MDEPSAVRKTRRYQKVLGRVLSPTCLIFAHLATTSGCVEEARAMAEGNTPPAGFLLAIGGGASFVEPDTPTPVLKASQVALHRVALQTLAASRAAGALVEGNACSLEYHSETDGAKDALAVSQSLFVAAGQPVEKFRGFVFDSRATASDEGLVGEFEAFCGVVYLPGGDQTEMRSLWERTRLQDALRRLVTRGGGILGKSAGAALQGTIGYFPALTSETTTLAFVEGVSLARRELEPGFLGDLGIGLPPFYVETHAGDRERTARALALLAAWEEPTGLSRARPTARSKQASLAPRASGVVVDSDTGALVHYVPAQKAWIAEVYGARAVEFLFPGANARSAWRRGRPPSYTGVTSHVLLEGGSVFLSGSRAGQILTASRSVQRVEPTQFTKFAQIASCADALPSTVLGRYDRDGERASAVYFDAFDPIANAVKRLGDVEFAYLTGDLRPVRSEGCGHWLTNAFDPDYGRPENRLNAQRYALGARFADFSIALALEGCADISRAGEISFDAGRACPSSSRSARESSAFLYDVAGAARLGVSAYIYPGMATRGAVQTGSWENGRVHLVAPSASFSLESRRVTTPRP